MQTSTYQDTIFVEKQVRIPSFTMTYAHSHNYYEIFYLRTGSCIYFLNDQLYHLSSGDIFIVYPGDAHYTQYEGLVPCERIIVSFEPSMISAEYWETHAELAHSLSHSGKVILSRQGKAQMENLLMRMIEEDSIKSTYSPEFLYLETLTLLLILQRDGIFIYEQMKPQSISSDIEDVLRYIAFNYALPLSLEEVAAQINLTPTYFSHKFKKVTGTTFKEYLNYIRIRNSCQQLLTTDDSITEIAINCGFNSSNYFKDCFRRICGISPREFRKNAQNSTHSFEFNTANAPVLKLEADSYLQI